MKAVLLIALLAILPFVLADRGYTQGHNGRPACQTDEELIVVRWRNNFDPTRYWECHTRNVPGVNVICKTSRLFLDSKKECVPVHEWVWTPLEDPPSMAPMP